MTNLDSILKSRHILFCQQMFVYSKLWFFQWSCMDVRVGLWRLSTKELMLLNGGVGEDSWESLGLQGDPTSPFWRRSAWDFFGRNDAKAETPVLWPPHAKSWLIGKDSDAGRDWGQEEKGTIGWDGWMASLTRWTWVWVNSGSWWWTGRPGVLRFMGSQRVGHDWATELNWRLTIQTTHGIHFVFHTDDKSKMISHNKYFCCTLKQLQPFQSVVVSNLISGVPQPTSHPSPMIMRDYIAFQSHIHLCCQER